MVTRGMGPKGIPCDLCGGMFFSRSIGLHRKQCASKMSKQITTCQDCNREVPMIDLKAHLASCPAFSKENAQFDQRNGHGQTRSLLRKITPVSSGNSRTLESHPRSDHDTSGFGASPTLPPNAFSNNSNAVDQDLGLVPCRVCGRTFTADRIQKHMGICKNVKKKRRVFDERSKRIPTDGTGDCFPMDRRRRDSVIEPVKTNWRQKSEEFRRIAKECREWDAKQKKQRSNATGQGRGTINRRLPSQPRSSHQTGARNSTTMGSSSFSSSSSTRPGATRTSGMGSREMGRSMGSTRTPPGSRQQHPSSHTTAVATGRSSGSNHTPIGSRDRDRDRDPNVFATAGAIATRGLTPTRAPPGKVSRSYIGEFPASGKTGDGSRAQNTSGLSNGRYSGSSGRIKERDPSPATGTRNPLVSRTTKEQSAPASASRRMGGDRVNRTRPAFENASFGREQAFGRGMLGGGGSIGGGNFSASNEVSRDNPMIFR